MGLKSTPGSLAEALDALEADHSFLTEGGVFTEDFIESYIAWKRKENTNFTFMLFAFDSFRQ